MVVESGAAPVLHSAMVADPGAEVQGPARAMCRALDRRVQIVLGGSTAVNFSALGLNPQDITTGMGPMIRVAISSTADSIVTMSVWLTPKND